MLIAGDVYRPAAIDQLVILGDQVLNFRCQQSGRLHFHFIFIFGMCSFLC